MSANANPQPPQNPQVKYCQECGAPNDINAVYCRVCGSTKFGPSPPSRISRPTGVTILAVLQIIGAMISFAVATAIAVLIPVIGILFYIVPIFGIISGIGLLIGKNWARIIAMIGAVIELFSVPIGTIIGAVVLWYLTRPRVVAYFKQNG